MRCRLDICWTSQLARRVYAVDINAAVIAKARSAFASNDGADNLMFVVGDMMKLDCPDGSFDLAYFNGVLSHEDDLGAQKALREAYRVLRPGGYVGVRDGKEGTDIIHPRNLAIDRSLELLYAHVGRIERKIPFGLTHRQALRAAGFEPIWTLSITTARHLRQAKR